MIYANDESDKELRKRNFILFCYIIPIVVTAAITGAIYLAGQAKLLNDVDSRSIYFFPFFVGLILFQFSNKHWLKLPGGNYYNIKGLSFVSNKVEPALYENEYVPNKSGAIFSVVYLLICVVGVYYLYVKTHSIIMPCFFLLSTIVILTYTIPILRDKRPVLKLAKSGLWTRKLGFRDWNEVAAARVENVGKDEKPALKIYLYGTIFAQANVEDDVILLSGLKGKEYIETIVETLKEKHDIAAQQEVE